MTTTATEWTTQTPTEAGWYWLRTIGTQAVGVYRIDGRLWVQEGNGAGLWVADLPTGCEWAGPIRPPE